ncbi:MAG: S1 RNA-binding domain-containing protein, partial [Actinomyces sp.]
FKALDDVSLDIHRGEVVAVIGASDGPSAEAARDAVNAIANPQMPEIGERFVGTVVKTTTFGAFVSLTPGKDGLLHISQIRRLVGGKRVENVEDVLNVGDKVQVELAEIDQRGKLSLHAVLTDEQLAAEAEGEASRKASREGGSRREAKDEDGEQPRRERRPRRRRMRSAESSEEE